MSRKMGHLPRIEYVIGSKYWKRAGRENTLSKKERSTNMVLSNGTLRRTPWKC
jgi:hypothetical protein